MKFRDYITYPCELRFMVDKLSLHTPFASRMLMDTELITDSLLLEENYRRLALLDGITREAKIFGYLCNVKDIENTIKNLAQGAVLLETELFELKNFAFLVKEIDNWCRGNCCGILDFPDLSNVFDILDPDKQRVTSFYIYNSYSPVLAKLREEFKAVQAELSSNEFENAREREGEIISAIDIEEEKVRTILSGKLNVYKDSLFDAFAKVGQLDLLIAKRLQIKELGLSVPEFSTNGKTTLNGLFHPLLKETLNNRKIDYQHIDVSFDNETICITGANMGGKTVAIKSTGLAQILFQFGFGIPAKRGVMAIKDDIMFSIEEEQSIREGLSSFAAEMLGINRIILAVKNGMNVLALIDEPARTTNPMEGTALVAGLIELFKDSSSTVLITTHYDIEDEEVRRYRVKGLIDGRMNYQLIEARKGEVPKEALTIARTIGINDEWIKLAETYLNTHLQNN